ncbi:uncharacterized protein LOC130012920 [Patella vulgata]|uniref:uncharacterized protein LOC130012920 n=1 Tax=Patella vulgata TaxID=6465 RepID=UPI0024A9B873|nr:uncharacterized protein LOC130012920 [Patella vulgata]
MAVIVLLWAALFRNIPSFWVGFDYQPNNTVYRVIRQCWFWQCAVTASVLLWHCRIGTWNVTLFLSKLTGPPIGFTAMGFLTVTKEVILTIFGLYLTYFFLLLQFKIS